LGGDKLERDYWSNLTVRTLATPLGYGLCVRRSVATYYANVTATDTLRRLLGRSGKELLSGDDLDLAWCAIDLGMGTGRFKDLKLLHLIPSHRLTEDYIIRLYSGYAMSDEILASIRPRFYRRKAAWKENIHFIYSYLRGTKVQRRIFLASLRARRKARKLMNTVAQNDLR
jgi:hypothetical protein